MRMNFDREDVAHDRFHGIIKKYFDKLDEDNLPNCLEVEKFREELVQCAMGLSDNNKAVAARLLNVNRTTLGEMLKRFRCSAFSARNVR